MNSECSQRMLFDVMCLIIVQEGHSDINSVKYQQQTTQMENACADLWIF